MHVYPNTVREVYGRRNVRMSGEAHFAADGIAARAPLRRVKKKSTWSNGVDIRFSMDLGAAGAFNR